jgi:ABC-type oligopeptide transport system substrate-binding subunit
MKRQWLAILMGVIVLWSLFPAELTHAEDRLPSIQVSYQTEREVTVDLVDSRDITTFDPALAQDPSSINAVENLFLGLTDFDPITNEVIPELATHWEIRDDGRTWIFHLNDDVHWVSYDAETEMVRRWGYVRANDVVYGVKRACDPRLGSYYGTIAARLIAGCDTVNQTAQQNVTDELVFGDTIRVDAPDDFTVRFQLQQPANYFLSMSSMWMLRPVPREIVETYRDNWTQPDNIVTSGPYMIEEWVPDTRQTYVRNPHLPLALLRSEGNIDQVVVHIIEDSNTSFVLYQDNELDISATPVSELGIPGPVSPQDVRQVTDQAVFYFGFSYDQPPFDDVRVRRAFSAILDREAFVEQIRQGRGVPMSHFTPPGMNHSPPLNESGMGFDPEYAQKQLASAGFRDCEGLPPVDIATYQGAETWGEFLVAAAQQYLGCSPDLFQVTQLEFTSLLQAIELENNGEVVERPGIWTLGWGPDYPDAYNWLGDVLHCTSDNNFGRPCTEVDDLIDLAVTTTDLDRASEFYRKAENGFFGEDGEFPMAPIYMRADYILVKPWFTGPFETDGRFGGAHWDAYHIDMAAKLEARE